MPSNSIVKDSFVIGGLTILGYLAGGKLGSMMGAVIGTVVCSLFTGEQPIGSGNSEPNNSDNRITDRPTPYSRSTSNRYIHKRKIKKIGEHTELSECSICLESFKPSILLWPCLHTCFCDNCYAKVLRKKVSTCPFCREHIDEFRST